MQRVRLLMLLVFALALTISAVGVSAQGDLPDLGGRIVTVAVENAYPPFNMVADDGETVGWDYDTVDEVCSRLNCVPEYIQASWEGMIVAVSNGEFDMAADGITITEERAQIVDFSEGYAQIIQRFMVQLDENRFSTVDDFVNGDFSIGVQLATTNFLTAQDLVGEDRIVGYSDFGSAVQALIAGDVDAVIIDDVAGQGYVGENDDQVALLDAAIKANEELGFIFEPGSELTDAFNAALQSMVADGTLNAINAAWDLGPYSGIGLLPDLGGVTVTVAVENAYPPFNMIADDGETVGWDYDTVNEICERLNCVPEYVQASWEGMIVAVGNGEFDMAADGITITEERAEIESITRLAMHRLFQRFMIQVGEDRFMSVDDFVDGDFSIGVQLATTNFLTAQDLVGEDRIASVTVTLVQQYKHSSLVMSML
ncbi:MAG: transporter substrate-binding domain-containing protein [Anaerolineae bacterium]|nr:transporter substrate-binding domain-containing protein [Anaerolineae bacterium]